MVTIYGLENTINEILIPLFHNIFFLYVIMLLYVTVLFVILHRQGVKNLTINQQDLENLQAVSASLVSEEASAVIRYENIIALLKADNSDPAVVAEIARIQGVVDDLKSKAL